jgi:hypothetical protein
MSTLTVQNLRGVSPTNQISVPTGHKLYAPGHILQVVQAYKTDAYTQNSGTWINVTGLTVSITPTSASSKILVICSVMISQTGGGGDSYCRVLRSDGVVVGAGNAGYFAQVAGQDYFQADCKVMHFLDSPSTASTISYTVQGNGTQFYLNARGLDGGFATASSIHAMEIGQ